VQGAQLDLTPSDPAGEPPADIPDEDVSNVKEWKEMMAMLARR
jgi:hypothetical protein